MAFEQLTKLAAILAVAAVAATPVMAAEAKKGSCLLAGGEANMVTEGLAKFMAEAALKNSIKGMNATGSGPVKVACNPNGVLQYCKATQKACK